MAKRKQTAQQENESGEVVVQLATRIPRHLQKALKLYSVENGVSISDFVAQAIERALGESGKRKSKAA